MSEPGKIKKLDEVVINRIAAGEVIQRPANALKEMIENCLDANSTNIQIMVKNGGLKLLQIQDNGSGIRREDFEIVCERFTTSKLREFEDLNKISTYGFRGEALASISHVAHLTIVSKTANEKCAYKASYEDGTLKDGVKLIARSQGTQISVEDLFYNMNVRRNALRSPAEEYQKISEIVGKYAIHNAKVGFSLKKQGENNDIRTPPNSSIVDNIRTIYGNAIARELIEFSMENQLYKVKAHGHITNVNYSTKKLQFVLFINHRLVDCQSLKKCLDQVYGTYLPKNTHPFIYISLEIDPRNIDVNVHPTKHEVHFLNEEQIIEAVASAVETKLLGSNNSRVFYTQAKLPGAPDINISTADKTLNKTVYDKDLVRTDSSEQKLEKFFGPATKKNKQDADDNDVIVGDDDVFVENNKELLKRADSFEHRMLNTTLSSNGSDKETPQMSKKRQESIESTFEKEKVKVPIKLKSVVELQTKIEDDCDDHLREIFADHVFVGSVNPKQTLIQHGTRLFLCNTEMIMRELFYQFMVFHFHNLNAFEFTKPLSIIDLVKLALEMPETGWTSESGDKNMLARRAMKMLIERREMLGEYFSMEITESGDLKTIPILIDKHMPEMSGLPMYLLRLATEVNWDEEKACFGTFCRETANYYAKMEEKQGWEHITEHILYPAIKDYFCPGIEFKRNGALLQVADLPKLYKVFERC